MARNRYIRIDVTNIGLICVIFQLQRVALNFCCVPTNHSSTVEPYQRNPKMEVKISHVGERTRIDMQRTNMEPQGLTSRDKWNVTSRSCFLLNVWYRTLWRRSRYYRSGDVPTTAGRDCSFQIKGQPEGIFQIDHPFPSFQVRPYCFNPTALRILHSAYDCYPPLRDRHLIGYIVYQKPVTTYIRDIIPDSQLDPRHLSKLPSILDVLTRKHPEPISSLI